MIAFSIPGEPVAKARPRVVNGHTYTPLRTRHAETQAVAALYHAHPGCRPNLAAAFAVDVTFNCGTARRRDIDNLLKLVLDALNGHVWGDDWQVDTVTARKRQVPRAEAGTDVAITLRDIEVAA